MRAVVLGLVAPAIAGAQAAATYSPPRILQAHLPDLPPPTVVGGGEVLIEGTVDRGGALKDLVVLRTTPPYAALVLDALRGWRFQAARASKGTEPAAPVDARIVIAAVYRPPTLFNGPTLGEPPKDVAAASGDTAYPTGITSPGYPPRAVSPAVLLFEVSVDERGRITETLPIASDPAFEAAARDALLRWTFRPALFDGRPAPATAYVVFGFQVPVVSSAPRLPPSR